MNLRNCAKHNRLLIQFNYPVSCKPKEVLVVPYISDNIISLNTRNERSSFTWLANKSQAQTEEQENEEDQGPDKNSITRIFQYSPEKKLLQEFDLVGILKD